MSRNTYRKCQACGDIHEVSAWPRECLEQFKRKRSELPAPFIRSDGMDAIMNHANGLMYDSRSAYERGVRDAGCEIVGSEKLTAKRETAWCMLQAIDGLRQELIKIINRKFLYLL